MLNNYFLLENLWLKALICFLLAYVIGFFSIKKYLNFVQSRNILRQPIRSDGPESHLKNKKNTPTMGGIFIIIATIIPVIFIADITNRYIWVAIIIFLVFGAIGLIDDVMKVVYKNPKGFRGSLKLVIQFLVISICLIWLGFIDETHLLNRIFFPFNDGYYLYLNSAIYVLFVNFVIVGSSNSVNLTDGLDGLVSVPSVIVLTVLSCLIYICSTPNLATHFHVPEIKFCGELIFFCVAMIGGILSFLTFNLKPAKIFMGDVGSLAIGSFLGLIAIIIKQEFIFLIISMLFVIEATSVILQVGSYKLRKKRIFLMAPIHHHFEKLGWSEKRVVRSFWLASLLFAICGASIVLF